MSRARVCVVRRGRYPTDPRLHRHVSALLFAGYAVDLICLRERGSPRREQLGGLRIRRVWAPPGRWGIGSLFLHYAIFLLSAATLVTVGHLRRRYRLIHVQSLPDVLVFAAAIPWLLGVRVLLDLSECGPEYLATRFQKSSNDFWPRVFAWLEQASICFADRALTCTEQMRETFHRRGADVTRIGVVLCAADEAVFDATRYPRRENENGDFVLVSHGSVERRYGLDTVIHALHSLRHEMPGLRLRVYGDGTHLDALARLANELGVEDRVWFSRGWVPIEELLHGLGSADAGVVAVPRDPFRDLTHTNKMFDYIAMRLPVLITRTQAVEAYFDDSCFELFESCDPADLAQAIRRLHNDPELRRRRVERALEAAQPYRWEHQREIYLAHVRDLVGETGAIASSRRQTASI
jgi:glycosyltransferase involved in cell wall biosynthesis